MNAIALSHPASNPRRVFGWLALAVLASLLTANAAHADPRHDRGPPRHDVRDWRRHESRNHRDWHGPRPSPGIVYAPPVVYQAPPPVESPGLNLIIPLNFH